MSIYSKKLKAGLTAAALLTAIGTPRLNAELHQQKPSPIKHVLLISIDGMHSLDFTNCANGISTVNGGSPYCPNLAALTKTGVNYLQAQTTRPSDSFPGLTAQITGGTTRSAGMFYDVNYDRSLSPPAQTTPYGIIGGPALCPSVVGTQVGFDEEIDVDLTRIDGGGGIDVNYLPRDPKNNCAPVFPHNYIRTNTIFEVVRAAGGYTAWTDKHPAYEFTGGPSGYGVDDFFGPEINSNIAPLTEPGYNVPQCHTLPDPGAGGDWTSSFQNIQCYDDLHIQAVLNQIDGRTHDGSQRAPVPAVFGANFQAVSIGQKLVEKSINTTGGYLDALGTPSPELLGEIQYVDNAIGQFVNELQKQGLSNSTLIIVSAKHGQSPIDPNRVLRIPADNPLDQPPSQIISPSGVGPGLPVAQASEDDVSLLWLTDQTQTTADVTLLAANENLFGQGEIFAGPSLKLIFNDPLVDSRVPDIVVAPNVGVIYTGGTKKVSEHGGFAEDDRHVMLVVSNPGLAPRTVTEPVFTTQIAPTILKALGLNPNSLQAVQQEGTQPLPLLP